MEPRDVETVPSVSHSCTWMELSVPLCLGTPFATAGFGISHKAIMAVQSGLPKQSEYSVSVAAEAGKPVP